MRYSRTSCTLPQASSLALWAEMIFDQPIENRGSHTVPRVHEFEFDELAACRMTPL
jgi:hypothetical protein